MRLARCVCVDWILKPGVVRAHKLCALVRGGQENVGMLVLDGFGSHVLILVGALRFALDDRL